MINSSHPPEEQHKDTENRLLPEEILDEVSRLAKELEEGFPLDVYPDEIQNIIKDAEQYLSLPADFLAASILAATATAIGNTFTAKLYPAPFKPLASVFLCLIGEPGIGKTHPLSFALKPLKDKDDFFYSHYEDEMKEHRAWERLSPKEKRLTTEPAIPSLKKFILNDATPEAVIRDHRDNPRGLTIHVDELSGWVSNFQRYSKGADVELYLSMWSGQPITVSRKTSEPIRVPQPCITVVGTSQPKRVAEFMHGFEENGMLQRFLFAIPRGLKKAKWGKIKPPTDIQNDWSQILMRLASENIALNHTGNPLPKLLDWSDEAQVAILSWQHSTADRMNESLDEVKERFAKLETYLPRFALILHLLRQATLKEPLTSPIPEAAVQGAIRLVNYFDREAAKVLHLIRGKHDREKMNQMQRDFFEALPHEFTTSVGIQVAAGFKIPTRTAEYWLQNSSWFEKVQHGQYKKRF